MRKNLIPAVIAFAPALLLPVIQDAVRPRISHAGLLGFVLSWAPDFVVGVLFPIFDSHSATSMDIASSGKTI